MCEVLVVVIPEPRDPRGPRAVDVLIVDDSPLVRTGLQLLLEQTSDLRVVGCADDGQQAVEIAAQVHPHVVLLDVRMPGMSGVETAGRLRELDPAPAVVMLSSAADGTTVRQAFDAGATGYLLKDTPPDRLLAGVREVAEGRPAVDARAGRTRARRRTQS